MEELTLDKFEEASEIVKEVNTGDKAGLQRIFQCSRPETKYI